MDADRREPVPTEENECAEAIVVDVDILGVAGVLLRRDEYSQRVS